MKLPDYMTQEIVVSVHVVVHCSHTGVKVLMTVVLSYAFGIDGVADE